MEHHSFSNVKLSEADFNSFTGGIRELLDKEKDERTDEWNYYFPSLKYNFPAAPKPNEKTKPLPNDQKIQNNISVSQ